MKTTKTLLFASLLCGFTAAHAQDKVVTATYGNATGNTTRTMTVALNHTTDYVAFHLVMDLPAGTTVETVTAKSPLLNGNTVDLSGKGGSATESTDFKVPFNQNGTKCNIVGYNYGNEKILGASGDVLLTVTLKTDAGVAFNADGVTTACTFVDASSNEVALGSPVTQARLWGDVDGNKVVDGIDASKIVNVALGRNPKSSIDAFAADVDENDTVDGIDASKIVNIALKR